MSVATYEAIGVSIDSFGDLNLQTAMPNLYGLALPIRIVTQLDGFTDERCVHFIQHAIQRNGAIFLHLTLLLEKEQVAEVTACQSDFVAVLQPAIGRAIAIEAAVWRLMVFPFNPAPE